MNYNLNKLSGYYSIYKITNLINGKVYIGFTKYKIKYRWLSHRSDAYRKTRNSKLYSAIRKYSHENFSIEEIYCSIEYEHTLKNIEPYFIGLYDTYFNGYNNTLGGEGNPVIKRNKSTGEKISKAKLGQKYNWKDKKILSEMKLKYNYAVTYPDGNIVHVTNLRAFCRDNNLIQSNMQKIALKQGRTQHKGFKVEILNGRK